ncbi:MAG: hypothetical protein CYPHOPRED_003146, partial [Cyphobasidiales sp. Tagirdzhanova-0007]
ISSYDTDVLEVSVSSLALCTRGGGIDLVRAQSTPPATLETITNAASEPAIQSTVLATSSCVADTSRPEENASSSEGQQAKKLALYVERAAGPAINEQQSGLGEGPPLSYDSSELNQLSNSDEQNGARALNETRSRSSKRKAFHTPTNITNKSRARTHPKSQKKNKHPVTPVSLSVYRKKPRVAYGQTHVADRSKQAENVTGEAQHDASTAVGDCIGVEMTTLWEIMEVTFKGIMIRQADANLLLRIRDASHATPAVSARRAISIMQVLEVLYLGTPQACEEIEATLAKYFDRQPQSV